MKHEGNITLDNMVEQVQDIMRKLVKSKYPWIKTYKASWPHLITSLHSYKPRLFYHLVRWEKPGRNRVKCNTDGASRGNPGDSALAFCIRNEDGDLVYARARGIGFAANLEAEMSAIHEALMYCQVNLYSDFILETDSLGLLRMINNEWKTPWEVVEKNGRDKGIDSQVTSSTNSYFQRRQ